MVDGLRKALKKHRIPMPPLLLEDASVFVERPEVLKHCAAVSSTLHFEPIAAPCVWQAEGEEDATSSRQLSKQQSTPLSGNVFFDFIAKTLCAREAPAHHRLDYSDT